MGIPFLQDTWETGVRDGVGRQQQEEPVMTLRERKTTTPEAKSLRDIRMCIDRRLPREKIAAAEEAALEERPDNLRVVPTGQAGPGRARMAVVIGSEWKPGSTLHVKFLEGDPVVKKKVEMIAHGWEDHANVRFVFDDRADAQIRITFKDDGSWSYIGKDATQIPARNATMNYGWLAPDTDDDEYSRVVLHEFGHALGAIHEHQAPGVTIPWDKQAVYAYYALQGWSKDDTDQNVLLPYSPEGMAFSMFDRKSIMLYAVDNRLTIGDWEVGWNCELSDMDKSFIRSRYPVEDKPIAELGVGATPVDAGIGTAGEVDWYRFVIDQAGRYVIRTAGKTDVVMSLHGPGSRAPLLAFDDDSGVGLNAKIQRRLDPGTYFVQVRHYGRTGVGKYQVSVARN